MAIQQFYNGPMVVIDYEHDKTHEGRFFSGGHYNASVANNGTLDILVQTSADHYTHAKFYASGGGDMTMQLFEDTTFSAAGTDVTMSNHNRASSKTFSGTVTHTPTVTGTGNQLNGTQFIPGGDASGGGSGGQSTNGGSDDFHSEFVLDKSTNYLLRVTNVSGSTTKVSAMIECYQPNL